MVAYPLADIFDDRISLPDIFPLLKNFDGEVLLPDIFDSGVFLQIFSMVESPCQIFFIVECLCQVESPCQTLSMVESPCQTLLMVKSLSQINLMAKSASQTSPNSQVHGWTFQLKILLLAMCYYFFLTLQAILHMFFYFCLSR